MKNHQETGDVKGRPDYRTSINWIILNGLYYGWSGLLLHLDGLRSNSSGSIADSSSCDPRFNYTRSCVFSIFAYSVAAVLATVLRLTLCFTNTLPVIIIRAWGLLSAVLLLIGYVFFYLPLAELIPGSPACATGSTSSVLAVVAIILYCLSPLVFILFIIRRFMLPVKTL